MANSFAGELGSLLYRQYGDLANPVSPADTLAKDIDFISQDKRLGELYAFALRLGLEQGATFANSHDAYTLNNSSAADYEQAQLRGSEMTVRADISYAEMTSLSPNKGKSSRGYDQGVGLKIVNTSDSAVQKRDMMLMYGPGDTGVANIGIVSAVGTIAVQTYKVAISRASYIPGFWQEAKNGLFDIRTSGGLAANSTATPAIVTAVDRDNATISFTAATWTNAPDIGSTIYFYGSRTSSMYGLEAIANNTTTLFNVDASVYPQWRAVQYAVGSTSLSFDKVAEALSAVADNGLSDGGILYLNPRTWTDLMTDEAALRRRINDTNSARTGYNKLTFELNCGIVEVKAYKYMKQGEALFVPVQECHRVGSSDITFTAPGESNKYFWTELPNNNGSQIRCYSDQAIVSENPSHIALFTGLSNAADVLPPATLP
jgi:hypothetical protein